MATVIYEYPSIKPIAPLRLRMNCGTKVIRTTTKYVVKESWKDNKPTSPEREDLRLFILTAFNNCDIGKGTNKELQDWLKKQVAAFNTENAKVPTLPVEVKMKDDYRHLLAQTKLFSKEYGISYTKDIERQILDKIMSILFDEPTVVKESKDIAPPIDEISRIIAFYEQEELLYQIKMNVTLPTLRRIRTELKKHLSREHQLMRTVMVLNRQNES